MAGKYYVRMGRRDVDVAANLPSSSGVEYVAEGINFSGHESRMKRDAFEQVLFINGLVDAGISRVWGGSGLEYGFNDEPYRKRAGEPGSLAVDVWLGLDSRGSRLGLRLSPEFVDRRDETELFGYAAVILSDVAWFVEDGRNFDSR